MNKSTHGGSRKGAGRKKNSGSFKEETKVIRVPVSLVDSINPAIEIYKSQIKSDVEVLGVTHIICFFTSFLILPSRYTPGQH